MKESQLYKHNEIEINVADLFWSVLRRWRKIILIMIIAAVVIGAVGFIREYRKYINPDKVASTLEQYEEKKAAYDREVESLETKIENCEGWANMLDELRERCLLLIIDPYYLYKIEASFYVDSNYEIIPENYYQNPNYTGALIQSYKSAIEHIDYESVIDMNGEDLTLQHPVTKYSNKNVYSISVNESQGLINLTVIGDTEERAYKVYNEILKVMNDLQPVLNETVTEHTVTQTAKTEGFTSDWEFEMLRQSFHSDYYQKNLESIDKTKQDLAKLTAPRDIRITKKSIIKRTIRDAVIGAFAGFVITVAWYALKFAFGGKINNAEELAAHYQKPLLGVIKQSASKENKLDRALGAKLGIPKDLSPEQSAKLIASNINLYMKDAKNVLLVGTTGSDAPSKLKDSIASELAGKALTACGDLNLDPAAVNALSEETAVICVEELQKSKHIDIAHELEKIAESENDKIGFVLVH